MDLKNICRAVLFPVQMLCSILKAGLSLLLPCKRRDLSGDVVLITGGGRGIGRHLAHEFAKQGARKVSYTLLSTPQGLIYNSVYIIELE